MERTVRKDFDWLLSRPRTAYEILDIPNDASSSSIRKAYRNKALLLHPDKNLDTHAEEQFREASVSYTILSDSTLRDHYDREILAGTSTAIAKAIDPKVSKFKTDLKEKEQSYYNSRYSQVSKQQKVEQLSQWFDEYIKSEPQIPGQSKSRSEDDIDRQSVFPKIATVKWKNKKSVIFDDELIMTLMEVFGPVKRVKIHNEDNQVDDNYHYAEVEFKSPVSAALASTHNYSTTADYWDKKNLRKVSSLLRSVKLKNYDKINLSGRNFLKLSSLDYIAFSIMES